MIKTDQVSLTTTRSVIVAAHPGNRQVALHAKGQVYIGGSDVTASNGYHMDNGDKLEITLPADVALYGITSTGTNVVSVLWSI